MIELYAGYQARQAASTEALPAGGYEAKIMKAEVIRYDWGDVLAIYFDISAGDHAGFFAKRWKQDEHSRYERKWKGVFRVNIPTAKSKFHDSDKRQFEDAMYAIEGSNSGYTFQGDELTLKGKPVGVLFRNKEWEMDGNTGWTTEACKFIPIADIRSGNFTVPKDKPLKQKASGTATTSTAPTPAQEAAAIVETISDDELPF